MNTLEKGEVELGRPSVIATLLWAFGIFIIGLTVYSMISWEGGVMNASLQGILLIFVSFSSGINAIATEALIDMHTMRYKTKKREYRENRLRSSCER